MYSIKAVSRATGLTVETLRAWERRHAAVAPQRDEQGRRVYSAEDVSRLRNLQAATDRGHPIGRLARLSNERLAALLSSVPIGKSNATTATAIVERILAAAEQYEAAGCDQPLTLAMALLPPDEIMADVLQPLLQEVGERWHRGEFTIAQERLVSGGVRRHLGASLETYARSARRDPIVFATLPGERHELGLLMCATLSASRGYAVHYLGVDLPPAEIARYARGVSARVIALSLVLHELNAAVPDQLRELAAAVPEGTTVWLGGPASSGLSPGELPRGCVIVRGQRDLEDRLDQLAA